MGIYPFSFISSIVDWSSAAFASNKSIREFAYSILVFIVNSLATSFILFSIVNILLSNSENFSPLDVWFSLILFSNLVKFSSVELVIWLIDVLKSSIVKYLLSIILNASVNWFCNAVTCSVIALFVDIYKLSTWFLV